MGTFNKEPVAITALLAGVVTTGIALAAVLWPERLTPELQAAIIAFANALIILVAAVVARAKVTPLAQPRLALRSLVYGHGRDVIGQVLQPQDPTSTPAPGAPAPPVGLTPQPR